jgi:hypothetical protein
LALDEEQRPTNEQGPANEGSGPPAAGRPLTRAEVEAILEKLGAWSYESYEQTRPLGYAETSALAMRNSHSFEKLDLSGLGFGQVDFFRANLNGANLSNAVFEEEVSLSEANLQGADFWKADLEKVELRAANLQGASLVHANLTGADLTEANLKDADLTNATLIDTRLAFAKLETALLGSITWSNNYIGPEETMGEFFAAEQVYRSLKRAHQNAGIYDIADQFAYREQVVRRKQLETGPRRVWSWLIDLFFGYGYHPERVIGTALAIFGFFALVYWLGGLYHARGAVEFGKSLYFSGVSFTAVGYGGWVENSLSPLKYLGAAEAIVGVFLMALFLITFTRQYLR